METLFEYLLKASTGIILFYLVYRLFLMKETFYEANRWFLVMALLFSVFLPLFPVHYPVAVQTQAGTGIFEGLTRDGQPITKTFNGKKDSLMKTVKVPPALIEIEERK